MHITKVSVFGWVKKHIKLVAGLSSGVVLGVTGSAVVLASIPDSSGVIHACYRTGTGILAKVRIIDNSTDSCTTNETAISWNQTGPQGPAGSGEQQVFSNYKTVITGTPESLFTVPNFGHIEADCDNGVGLVNDTTFTWKEGAGSDIEPGSIAHTNRQGTIVSYADGSTSYTATFSVEITGDNTGNCLAGAQVTVSKHEN